MATPDNSAERPEQSIAERLAEQTRKAEASAEWAVTKGGDDLLVAGELQRLAEARLAEINQAVKDEKDRTESGEFPKIHENEVTRLEAARGDYLGRKTMFEQAAMSGEMSDEVREHVESYREGVQQTIKEVIDGDVTGLSEVQVDRYREMAKDLVKRGLGQKSD